MRMSDLLISIRRTIVPVIVGLTTGSFLGPYVDPDALEKVVTGVVTALYYVGLRLVESRLPSAGILLGARKQPVYVQPPSHDS